MAHLFYRILVLVSLVSLSLAACNKSCHKGSCSISGSSGNENCRCSNHVYGHLAFEYASCKGQGAKSVAMNVLRNSCSIKGDNAVAALENKIFGSTVSFVPRCRASSATQCSQVIGSSQCQIVGTNAECRGEFLTWGQTTWLIPKCNAYKARSCSITCPGVNSCAKDCGGDKSFPYAVCRCAINQSLSVLRPECFCSKYP
ncbi:hypothetical protein RCL1_006915 [Eukaryota sp. TZLM3-RCL]